MSVVPHVRSESLLCSHCLANGRLVFLHWLLTYNMYGCPGCNKGLTGELLHQFGYSTP